MPVNLPPVVRLELLLLLLALGGWLLFTARRRRPGDAPHCMMCGYNLTGLAGTRCPECGVELTPDNCSIGPLSEFRPARFVIGMAIVGGILIWVLWGYYQR